MVRNPPENSQRIIPYIHYRDAEAAIEFICRAFGFSQGLILPGEDEGMAISHAELQRDGETLMLASEYPPNNLQSPLTAGASTGSVLVYVDDVDAHYARAKAEGAEIAEEPTDQFYGDRTYTALDTEGRRWSFHQHVEDVDFGAPSAGEE